MFIKQDDALYLAECQKLAANEAYLARKSMSNEQNVERSPYNNQESSEVVEDRYRPWVRATWFPPAPKQSKVYRGKIPAGLFAE